VSDGTARRRVRRASLRCIWPKCPRERSHKYDRLPLCSEHARVVAHQVDVYERLREQRIWDETNAIRARKGLALNQRLGEYAGVIYYLRIAGQIKIGHTKDLAGRIRAYPPSTEILAMHDGSREDEAALHAKFLQYRVAGREWYREAPELTDHIDRVIEEHGSPPARLKARREVRPNRQAVMVRGRSGGRYSRKQAS
jgi:hypothetical protein